MQKRIKWIENYSRGNTNRPSYINEISAKSTTCRAIIPSENHQAVNAHGR